ncbi:pyridoxal phosphate-dependent aminotransferase, partial [bacterium]
MPAIDPDLSAHFADRQPSGIRIAGIRFEQRQTPAQALNTAIGNVSLPMHPAMQERMRELGRED